MAPAKELSMNAATAAALSELGGILTAKEEQQKNSAEGFSQWTALFHFTPDCLWQERC